MRALTRDLWHVIFSTMDFLSLLIKGGIEGKQEDNAEEAAEERRMQKSFFDGPSGTGDLQAMFYPRYFMFISMSIGKIGYTYILCLLIRSSGGLRLVDLEYLFLFDEKAACAYHLTSWGLARKEVCQ